MNHKWTSSSAVTNKHSLNSGMSCLQLTTIKYYKQFISLRCPRGVMVKAMDYGIVVSEFELHSRYYVHFLTNTLGKGMNPLLPPSYGLNSTTTVLLGE